MTSFFWVFFEEKRQILGKSSENATVFFICFPFRIPKFMVGSLVIVLLNWRIELLTKKKE